MARRNRVYGTSGGVPVDDELIERLAAEAERGYDDAVITRGLRGRPSLGSSPARTLTVKVEPELADALSRRADADGLTVSQLLRRAMRMYLAS
jgi:CRISPR-associated endonuclease/helicase Cas3